MTPNQPGQATAPTQTRGEAQSRDANAETWDRTREVGIIPPGPRDARWDVRPPPGIERGKLRSPTGPGFPTARGPPTRRGKLVPPTDPDADRSQSVPGD